MDRREFLKSTALATAGAAVMGCSLAGSCKKQGDSAAEAVSGEKTPLAYQTSRTGRLKLSWAPYELKLHDTFTVSTYSRTTTPDVQVELEYEGFVGYGEASMPQYLGHTVDSVCSFLSKVKLSQFNDPYRMEDILDYVDGVAPGNEPAKAAIDIALHDLVGKMLGAPWYRIWGLNPARTPSTSFTIGIDTPEVVAKKTAAAVGRFNILKVKVGLDTDRELIESIRSVTDLPLCVDANRGWTSKYKALEEIYWLSEHGVVMVEQPMEGLDDNAWLTERSPLPIFADESVQKLKDIDSVKGAFDGINVKLMKCGGMSEAYRMLSYCKAVGMKAMIGCMTETSCAVTAAAHLSPMVEFADLDGNLLIDNDRFSGVLVEKGKLVLPDRPGLGLDVL